MNSNNSKMKAVIFAGGFGTRISEESGVRPKPMVEIGGKPILWHIMKMYTHHGINDFVILCGYKSHIIKEYFANYELHRSDLTFDFTNHSTKIHKNGVEPWRVTLVETGEDAMTGGRLLRAKEYLKDGAFCLTYGDGVSDIDITQEIEFHKKNRAIVTMAAVQPPGRFGAFTLKADSSTIETFQEKPDGDGAWINGGFFVVEPEAIDYIENDQISWEKEPLQRLAQDGKLAAYKHSGFWQCMDTLRDKNYLNELLEKGQAPWKTW